MSAIAVTAEAVEANEPPEARGVPRDGVRLLAAYGDGRLEHTRFRRLPDLLTAGDLLVVNTSATLPAAVPATLPAAVPAGDASGTEAIVHFSTHLPGDLWLVELRRPVAGGASEPWGSSSNDSRANDSRANDSRANDRGVVGPTLELPGGATAELLAPWARGAGRLWFAALELSQPFLTWLHRHGRPIRYGYVPRAWPLAMYQTVFAREPGSAEMPSAARPFSPQVVTELVSRGVGLTPLMLHTGVSSGEAHESPYPERYRVPVTTARRVNEARAAGGRVIAVGTTVVRALETVVDERGVVHPGEGWTEVVVTPARGVRAVDGMITGWHDPEASHLQLLEAVAGRELLDRSYDAARSAGYRWHEFGDSHLLLPDALSRPGRAADTTVMSALTAIVCDDDPETRQAVSRLVSACGFEVAAELDLAVGAVAVADVVGPTVVLLDLSFPGLSSLKAIPLLREAAPGCEVVVCSAYETVRPAALRAGATEVVDKGDLHRLEQVLRKIAELRGATSEAVAP